MKNWLSMTAAVALVLSSGVGLPAGAQTSGGGATISKEFGCYGFVPTPSGEMGASLYTTDAASSVNSGSGSITLTCHFDIPADLKPAKTTRAHNFECFVFDSSNAFESTRDSRMQANSGGNATLDCRIK